MERCLELAKKAGLKGRSETGLSPQEERFAELIIRECAEIAFNQWVDNGSEESPRPTILRQFGLT